MGIQYIQELMEDKRYFFHVNTAGTSSSKVDEFETLEEAIVFARSYMKENPGVKLDDFPQNTDRNSEYLFTFSHGVNKSGDREHAYFGVRYPNLSNTSYPSIVASILSRDDWNNLAENHLDIVLDV